MADKFSPEGNAIAVELRGASHHYGVRPVLRDINLTVRVGQRVVIVGPNGMGKYVAEWQAVVDTVHSADPVVFLSRDRRSDPPIADLKRFNPMSRIACFCSLVLLAAEMSFGAEPSADGFRPLFNGRDLSGWVLVNTPAATWTVKDEMLVCSGKPVGEIRTDRMYQNFILELEWRHMVPKGNAGVFIWADDVTARGVPFHRSVEVQVLENAYGNSNSHTTHGDIFPIHGATMTPINGRGGSRAFPTEERSKPSPEWNHYRITCQDGEISLAVNSKVVTRGKDASPRKGYVCLESEGGIVHYRNLRIQELPDTPIDPAHVAVANRGYGSLYTGLDLSGWTAAADVLPRWQVNDWVLAYGGPASAGDGPLSTSEKFGDIGFLFDVRLKEGCQSVSFKLRDGEDSGFIVAPDTPALAGHLQKPGQWNRFEGTIRGNRLTVTLNGHEVITDKPLTGSAAPFTIAPRGAADFANIFVRELK